jgi:hypothetical protein
MMRAGGYVRPAGTARKVDTKTRTGDNPQSVDWRTKNAGES